MVAWAGTKTNMTVVGADLQLDEGAAQGSYLLTSQDLGAITWHFISFETKVEESPASTGFMDWKIEINLSDDDAAWGGWKLYLEGEYKTRYFNLRITVYGDPASGQRPKITRFEGQSGEMDSLPCPAPILNTRNAPAGTEVRGDRYRVGTGAGDWAGWDESLVECVDATTPSWRRTIPKQGTRVWDENANEIIGYDEFSEWVTWDPRKLCAGHETILAPSWVAQGAGIWTVTADNAQYMNGHLDNYAGAAQADLDEVDYQVCLKMGTYTVIYWTKTSVGHAIIDIDIDNGSGATEIASFDCYANPGGNNQRFSDAGNVIVVADLYTVTVRVHGRNVNANDWKADIGYVAFFRTA